MNLEHETSFVVMPNMTNYMVGREGRAVIFGGAFLSEMDLCAATCVSRLLQASDCNESVTHKVDVTFHSAALCGDIVFMRAEITGLRKKGIEVYVRAEREKRAVEGRDLVASGSFVFVSKKKGVFCPHGLSMDDSDKSQDT